MKCVLLFEVLQNSKFNLNSSVQKNQRALENLLAGNFCPSAVVWPPLGYTNNDFNVLVTLMFSFLLIAISAMGTLTLPRRFIFFFNSCF